MFTNKGTNFINKKEVLFMSNYFFKPDFFMNKYFFKPEFLLKLKEKRVSRS